jgi:hypothetical protein
VRIAFVVVIAAVGLLPERVLARVALPKARAPSSVTRAAAGAALLAIAACLAFPLSYARNATFGDGPRLPPQIARGEVFAAEPLATWLMGAARRALAWVSEPPSSVFAIRLVDAASGAIFAASIVIFAAHATTSRGRAVALASGVAVAGTTAMFFGYVETTAPATAFVAAYFAAALAALARPRGATTWPLACAVGALALAVLSHVAFVLLLPSCAALLVLTEREPTRVLRLFSLRNLALVTGLLVVPCALGIVFPFVARGDIGNMAGGADGIQWVPLHVDPAHRPSPWIAYSLLSSWHFADLASSLLVAAPLAPALLAAALFAKVRGRVTLAPNERRALAVLGLGACFALVVPLFWNHDFGMWGDWNLAATYLLPLHLFAWTAFVVVSGHFEVDRTFYARAVVPLVLAQAMCALGLVGQLS